VIIRIAVLAAGLSLFIAGCGGAHSIIMPTTPSGHGVNNHVIQNGKTPINWTQFNDPQGYTANYAVVAGPDKNVWFGNGAGGLMRVQMSGKMKLFPLQYNCNGGSACTFTTSYGVTVGKDHNFYIGGTNFDQNTNKYVIGVATTQAALTVHDIPSGDFSGTGGLSLGPDGNVWFTEQSHIAKINTTGTINEFAYPSGATSNSFGSTTPGPDGNVWFTEYNNAIVGFINPSTKAITEYNLSAQGFDCPPSSIVTGSDGNLYFSCGGNLLGQITPGGVAKVFSDSFGISVEPSALAIGPDGDIWFATGNGDYISKFDPTVLAFTVYIPPYGSSTFYQIALGPDNNFWAAESDDKTDVFITSPLTVSPASITFTATGQTQDLTVGENGVNAWTAKSASPGVCGVAQGGHANIFTVTAAGVGSTKITIKDAIGNSFVVPCKVT